MDEKKQKQRNKIWLFLMVIFAGIAVLSTMFLIKQHIDRQHAIAEMENLKEVVNTTVEESTPVITPEPIVEETVPETAPVEVSTLEQLGIEIPEKELDWEALREENEDIYAWIYVPDTTVDYPILQHPTDNAYYLNHNLDGSKGYPGVIYTEDYNAKDFSDCHTVIYGHNLKDKTMFSSLHNFESEEMMAEDHYIFIYTEDTVLVYRIFASYEFNAIHLLDNYDLSNVYVYEQYIKDIYNVPNTNLRAAIIRDDIEVTKEDKIVTLSTCTTDHNANFRYLVVGVLLNPEALQP